jgi:hypothetical protein
MTQQLNDDRNYDDDVDDDGDNTTIIINTILILWLPDKFLSIAIHTKTSEAVLNIVFFYRISLCV